MIPDLNVFPPSQNTSRTTEIAYDSFSEARASRQFSRLKRRFGRTAKRLQFTLAATQTPACNFIGDDGSFRGCIGGGKMISPFRKMSERWISGIVAIIRREIESCRFTSFPHPHPLRVIGSSSARPTKRFPPGRVRIPHAEIFYGVGGRFLVF